MIPFHNLNKWIPFSTDEIEQKKKRKPHIMHSMLQQIELTSTYFYHRNFHENYNLVCWILSKFVMQIEIVSNEMYCWDYIHTSIWQMVSVLSRVNQSPHIILSTSNTKILTKVFFAVFLFLAKNHLEDEWAKQFLKVSIIDVIFCNFYCHNTYPIAPLENAFNSRFSVDLTLSSEYKPIGELNCLWTIFRCTFAIFLSFYHWHSHSITPIDFFIFFFLICRRCRKCFD